MSDDSVVQTAFFIVFGFFILLLVIISLLSIPLRTKALANAVTLTLKLQGTHRTAEQVVAQVDIYNGPQKVASQSVTFTYNGAFTGILPLQSGFNFTDFYALFVKPEKFTGRIFCNNNVVGKDCVSPQMIFSAAGSALDLTSTVILGGDIAPANGKVDARDMSVIMKNLGKNAPETDINGDGITDVTDYSLALYSLGQNAADDTVNLQSPGTPSSTPSPAVSATAAPSATGTPTATPAPSATTAPTPTVTPTPTPTPTTAAAAKCHFTLPAGYGDPFDINAGVTSACECEDAPFFGQICSTVTCKTCPSGTCNCTIEEKMPPYTANCTNGGSMSVNKVSSCN